MYNDNDANPILDVFAHKITVIQLRLDFIIWISW